MFLNAIWPQPGAVALKRFVLYGIAAFAAGVGIAMLGYVVRYWGLGRGQGPGLIAQIANVWIPVLAVACFVAGMVLPVIGGLDTLSSQSQPPPPTTQTVPAKKR